MNLRAGTRERARSNWRLLLLIILLAAGSLKAYGIGEPVRVHFTAQPSTLSFELVGAGGAVPIYVDKEYWQGVRRAVVSFAGDISSVTVHRPQIGSMLTPHDADVVMVSTLGKSALIDGLVAAGRIDVEAIRGH